MAKKPTGTQETAQPESPSRKPMVIEKGEPNQKTGTWAWKFNFGPTEPARLFVSCRRCGRQQCSVDEKSIGDCVCGEPLSKATLKDFEAAPKPKKA